MAVRRESLTAQHVRQTANRVHRRIVACARCRRRKTKCDGKLPACTPCQSAQEECIGYNATDGAEIPRSVVLYLESELAALEARLLDKGIDPDLTADQGSSFTGSISSNLITSTSTLEKRAFNFQKTKHTQDTSNEPNRFDVSPTIPGYRSIIKTITPAYLGFSENLQFPKFVVGSSSLPDALISASERQMDDHPFFSVVLSSSLLSKLESIPVSVADHLINNYVERILPQYPVLLESDVLMHYKAVYGRTQAIKGVVQEPANNNDIFILSIIMAISATTATQANQARAIASSETLFNTAIQNLPSICTNDLKGIQAVLLILQYACLNPSAANLWFLVGIAMRACIEYGLHRDVPASFNLDPLSIDLRRRLFWVMYEMNVGICVTLLRPIALFDETVKIHYPSEYEDSCITPQGITKIGRRNKTTAIRIWKFRQFQHEVFSVLFQNAPVHTSLEEWMENMEAALRSWHREIQSSSQAVVVAEIGHWSEIALHFGLVSLYRPAPRIRYPTRANMLKSFEAAGKMAWGYWQQSGLGFGYLKYSWHAVHHVFDAGTVYVYCLRNCKEEIRERYTILEVEENSQQFFNCFNGMSERWPAATRCAETFQRLLKPVFDEFTRFVASPAASIESLGSASLRPSEIEGLLFPQTLGAEPAFEPRISTPYNRDTEIDFGMFDDVMNWDVPTNFMETVFGPETLFQPRVV